MKRSIALILTFSCLALHAQQSIHDIINTDNCPGIEPVGEPELYIGDDLFSLINGGAELYHEFGFVEVLAAEFILADSTHLKAEIYDMGSPDAAWGIFSLTATSNAKVFNAGVAGRRGEGFAQFIKGNYMIYIYFDHVEIADLQYVAGCIQQKIENSYPAPLLMKSVSSGKENPDKTVYFKGNLGLSGIYSFHYKDVFGYDEGAAAIYPEMKVFLLSYKSEEDCIEKYNTAKEFFMNSSKYHDQLSLRGSFHIKDRKEQQIDCYFENTFLIVFISNGESDLNLARETVVESMQ